MNIFDRYLFIVMITITAVMAIFEIAKQMLFPGITLLGSHILTVLFATLAGTVAAGYALVKYRKINQSLGENISRLAREAEELKRAEEELRANEHKFSQFFMGVPVALGVVNKDGVITYFNNRFTKIFGYTTEDVPTIERWWELAYPDKSYRQQVMESWAVAAAKAEKGGADIEPAVYRVAGKDGVEHITEIGGFFFGDNLLATFIDITGRRETEDKLRASEKRYRQIIQTSMDGFWITDAMGYIIDVNDAYCQMTGYSREELLTMRITDVEANETPEETAQHILEVITKGYGRFIVSQRRKDGKLLDIEVSAVYYQPDTGGGYFFVFLRDITENRFAAERIRKLNEELELKVRERTQQLLDAQDELIKKEKLSTLGQIAGSVGHELRNPLGVMSNAVYFLRAVLPDADESVKEYLGIIEGEIANSDRIVSDLLDSVRTKPPQAQLITPAGLIETSLSKCKIPGNIEVVIKSGTRRSLKVDPMQMEQVFINLIKNGAEAMADGGSLHITVEDDENKMIKFRFQDTGTGIAPGNIPKLFTPLFTTKPKGIGLGLVVIKNLTEANGGKVEVVSPVAGRRGTEFIITFPAGAEEESDESG